jgi:hypothetical protein
MLFFCKAGANMETDGKDVNDRTKNTRVERKLAWANTYYCFSVTNPSWVVLVIVGH